MREACLAVRMYNDPAEARSFEAFVIHMHLAWMYLLHAQFLRDGIDFRYWDKTKKNRLAKVDGEPKLWDLDRSLRERWTDPADPVRSNLALYVRLRNRLEHRHAQADVALMLHLAGHSHALLLNFERELTTHFGSEQSLAHRIRLPLFIGTFSPGGEMALRKLRKALPRDLASFLTDYEAGLKDHVRTDPQYEFRLRATLELAPKDPDAVAIQFTHLADMTDDERATVEGMGRKGQVIIKDRKQSVSGLGRLMPGAAVAEVDASLPFQFKMHHFTAAWRHFNARPEKSSSSPDRTNPDWCEYDEPTRTYRYTRGYLRMLTKRCATETGFFEVTGFKPVRKTA